MADDQVVTVKFLVDKVRKRVLFAEAGSDFVDILFSFLTLPLGTIIRLLNKKSGLGCMDKLYESVENLAPQHFQTKACKTMLVSPCSAAGVQCENLKINIDDTKPGPRRVYVCQKPDCCSRETCLASSVQDAWCPHCRGDMVNIRAWSKSDENAESIFVKQGDKFIVSDDLHIMPASVENSLSFLLKMGIDDASVLEERTMDLNREEVLALLQRLLVYSAPLTDLCFQNTPAPDSTSAKFDMEGLGWIKTECNEVVKSECVSVKLFIDGASNKVSFLEGGEEFVNILFSYLTLPLGSVVKLLDKNFPVGCAANLYMSVEKLWLECFKSEECKNMLISPKLGAFSGISGNMMMVDEIIARGGSMHGCYTCYWNNKSTECKNAGGCIHGVKRAVFKELNPKSPVGGTKTGGGFVKGPTKFYVNNLMSVSPASPIDIIRSLECSFSKLKIRNHIIGEVQALDLLRAVMSESSLVDIFATGQRGTEGMHYYPVKQEYM